MKKTIFLSFLFFSLRSNLVYAKGGHLIGNGGYALKCDVNGSTNYEVYDIYEAKLLTVFNISNLDYGKGNTYIQKARSIFSRIEHINPSRFKQYIDWTNEFESKSYFTILTPPSHTNDSTLNLIPLNCELIPVISNYLNTYHINTLIWNQLNEDQKATLVVHEVIFNEALAYENRHSNSFFVRHFTRHLLNNSIAKMSLKDYLNFIQNISFTKADAHGFSIALNKFDSLSNRRSKLKVEFWDNASVKSATLYWKGTSQTNGINLDYNCGLGHWDLNQSFFVSFYANHKVNQFHYPITTMFPCEFNVIELKHVGFNGKMTFNSIKFSEEGQITSLKYHGYLENFPLLELDTPKDKLKISAGLKPLSIVQLEVIPFYKIRLTGINKKMCQEELLNYLVSWNSSDINSSTKFISYTIDSKNNQNGSLELCYKTLTR